MPGLDGLGTFVMDDICPLESFNFIHAVRTTFDGPIPMDCKQNAYCDVVEIDNECTQHIPTGIIGM